MRYIELKININKNIFDELIEFLDSSSIQNYYEILFDLNTTRSGKEIIKDDTILNVYLDETDQESELKILIYLNTFSKEQYFIERRIIESKEYEEAYKEFYKPFPIGSNFYLVPSWEKEEQWLKETLIKENRTPIYLNPGLAFGTGHHETTKMMIERMEQIIQPSMKVVDMGCGSGVLAITALLLKADIVYCYDIDANAVKATLSNIKDNDNIVDDRYKVFLDSFTDPFLLDISFDIFLANITYSIISGNIDSIARLKTQHFLFSGLLSDKIELLKELLSEKIGGNMVYSATLNDWAILEWKK